MEENQPDMLKVLNKVEFVWLAHLCNGSWRSVVVPLNWQTGMVIIINTRGSVPIIGKSHASASWGKTLQGFGV